MDIYNRAKKLHIEMSARRVVFIIETNKEKDSGALETVRSMFATQTQDFITAVDEKNIILVKEIGEKDQIEDLEKTAQCHRRHAQYRSNVPCPCGIRYDRKRTQRSFQIVQRSRRWLSMSERFSTADKKVVAYSNLGIGRLIYQLPMPLCKMFIKEIFEEKTPDQFDEETLTTINKFFENNLNVSETSRQLYIHRNTLVYRLDKLEKSTGLDLRIFDDAITFKIALMVVKYMNYLETIDY